MSGHSKWSTIKRLKGALDAKRGKLFSKLSKEITVAAKMGGADASANARLRSAVLSARAQNMPNDNIERAIKRGSGELEGQHYEELVYEGYGPGGVALIVEVMTDNKNRTAAELRTTFTKNHGNLATSGSVSYMFQKKGLIIAPRNDLEEDRMLEIALEAGAEELVGDGEHFVITTAHDQFYAVAEAVRKAGVAAESQKLTFVPDTHISVRDEALATQTLRLCEALEECEDVQNVYANFDIPDEILSRVSS